MKRSICIIKDFANQLSLDLLCLNKITNEWELVNKYHHSLSANEKSDLADVIKTDLAESDFQKSKLTVLIDGDYLLCEDLEMPALNMLEEPRICKLKLTKLFGDDLFERYVMKKEKYMIRKNIFNHHYVLLDKKYLEEILNLLKPCGINKLYYLPSAYACGLHSYKKMRMKDPYLFISETSDYYSLMLIKQNNVINNVYIKSLEEILTGIRRIGFHEDVDFSNCYTNQESICKYPMPIMVNEVTEINDIDCLFKGINSAKVCYFGGR